MERYEVVRGGGGGGGWATVKKNKRGEVKVSHLSPDGKFKSFCRT